MTSSNENIKPNSTAQQLNNEELDGVVGGKSWLKSIESDVTDAISSTMDDTSVTDASAVDDVTIAFSTTMDNILLAEVTEADAGVRDAIEDAAAVIVSSIR